MKITSNLSAGALTKRGKSLAGKLDRKPLIRFPLALSASLFFHTCSGLTANYTFFNKNGKTNIEFVTGMEEAETFSVRSGEIKALETEKARYLEEMLKNLQGGSKIKISDFLIKSEGLDNNIELLKQGKSIVSEKSMLEEYQRVRDVQASKWAAEGKSVRGKIGKIHHFMHYQLLEYYFLEQGDLTGVFKTRQYNCASSTLLFTALTEDLLGAEEMGIVLQGPGRGSRTKSGHMFSWYREGKQLWTIENTLGAPPRLRKPRKGLYLPKDILVAAYFLRNGYRLDQLPGRFLPYYKEGIGSSGLPVTSIPTEFPDPPEFPMPNRNFRQMNPPPVWNLGGSTNWEKERLLAGRIDHARKTASVIRFMLDLAERPDDVITVKVPERIDWCSAEAGEIVRFVFNTSLNPLRRDMFLRSFNIAHKSQSYFLALILLVAGEHERCFKRLLASSEIIDSNRIETYYKATKASFLAKQDKEIIIEYFKEAFLKEKKDDYLVALRYLIERNDRENIEFIASELKSKNTEIRLNAMITLAVILGKESKTELIRGLENEDDLATKINLKTLLFEFGDIKPLLSELENASHTYYFNSFPVTPHILPKSLDAEQKRQVVEMLNSKKRFFNEKAFLAYMLFETGEKKTAHSYAIDLLNNYRKFINKIEKMGFKWGDDAGRAVIMRFFILIAGVKSPEVKSRFEEVFAKDKKLSPFIGYILAKEYGRLSEDQIGELKKVLIAEKSDHYDRSIAALALNLVGEQKL